MSFLRLESTTEARAAARPRGHLVRGRPPPRPKLCPVTCVSVHAASLVEPVELHLLDRDLGRAAVRDDERHLHRLPRHDDPVVGQRLDADAVRGDHAPAGTRAPSGAGGTRFRTGALSSIASARSWLRSTRTARSPSRAAAPRPRRRFRCRTSSAPPEPRRTIASRPSTQILRRLGAGKLRQPRDATCRRRRTATSRRAASDRESSHSTSW